MVIQKYDRMPFRQACGLLVHRNIIFTDMDVTNVILNRKSRAQHGSYKLVITLTELYLYLSTKLRNKSKGI